MDPYAINQLATSRHDDLVREADESRVASQARDGHEDSRPGPPPKRREARWLRFA
jgi:hypothetical protein